MDVLSDVLAAVRLTGAIFFDNTFHEPWVAEAPKASAIAVAVMPISQYVFFFHTLIEGSCWAELTDSSLAPIRLHAGDIVAFPMDDAHALCSSIGMRAKPDLAVYHSPVDWQLPMVQMPEPAASSAAILVATSIRTARSSAPYRVCCTGEAPQRKAGWRSWCTMPFPKPRASVMVVKPCLPSSPNCSSLKSYATMSMPCRWTRGVGFRACGTHKLARLYA